MRGADPSRYLEWLRALTAPTDPLPAAVVPLDDSLIHPRLLIVGEAGCGKTAYLRQLAYLWCRGLQDTHTYTLLFPIFVSMSEAAAETGDGWLIDLLHDQSREHNWGLDPEFFRHKLGAAFVLLDGLHDAPWAARPIERMAVANPLSRFVVSTRPIGRVVEILAGFHTVRAGRNREFNCAAGC
jgi:hypothetical protein